MYDYRTLLLLEGKTFEDKKEANSEIYEAARQTGLARVFGVFGSGPCNSDYERYGPLDWMRKQIDQGFIQRHASPKGTSEWFEVTLPSDMMFRLSPDSLRYLKRDLERIDEADTEGDSIRLKDSVYQAMTALFHAHARMMGDDEASGVRVSGQLMLNLMELQGEVSTTTDDILNAVHEACRSHYPFDARLMEELVNHHLRAYHGPGDTLIAQQLVLNPRIALLLDVQEAAEKLDQAIELSAFMKAETIVVDRSVVDTARALCAALTVPRAAQWQPSFA